MGTPVVLDTNVLISGYLWNGPPSKILQLFLENKIDVIVSDKQYHELKRVINYSRIGISTERQKEFIETVLEHSVRIVPRAIVRGVQADPSDNALLEAAFEGKAKLIVTGDKHLLRLKQFTNTPIITPSQFLKLWESGSFLNNK